MEWGIRLFVLFEAMEFVLDLDQQRLHLDFKQMNDETWRVRVLLKNQCLWVWIKAGVVLASTMGYEMRVGMLLAEWNWMQIMKSWDFHGCTLWHPDPTCSNNPNNMKGSSSIEGGFSQWSQVVHDVGQAMTGVHALTSLPRQSYMAQGSRKKQAIGAMKTAGWLVQSCSVTFRPSSGPFKDEEVYWWRYH